jgi:hypothetical protein
MFLKAATGGGGATSVSVIIDGVELMEPLDAEIVDLVLEAELVDVVLDAEIPAPLDAELK